MPGDFEEQLRRSLTARAGDVAPDPALFARVQSRITRRRTFRVALAGAAGALAIAGAAVAAPTMMDRRVEFEPGPVADQPPSEATPAASPTATATAAPGMGAPPTFVFTDGGTAQLSGGGSLLSSDAATQSVAARPGSTRSDITLAVAEGADCGVVRYGAGGTQPPEVEEGPAPPPLRDVPIQDGCAATPVFSPDGGSLAWVATTDDGWTIQTIDWTDSGPGDNDAAFGLPWPTDQHVDLQDWVWDEQTAMGAKGHLIVRTQRQGAWMLLRIPIERQGDGSLGIVLDAVPVAADGGEPVAFASAGNDVTYTMELEFAENGPRNGVLVWRTGDEVNDADGGFTLPPELYSGPDFNVADLWMTAGAEAVLFGNAATGQAWWIPVANDSINAADARSRPPLRANGENGTIVHADLLVAPSVASPGAAPTDTPVEPQTTQVEVFFGMTGADACVADQPVQRLVEGAGVARAALESLLEGPTSRESNEGVVSPFSASTAGTLNDIAIVDGEARVDFVDFSAQVPTDSCTKSAILDSLERTLGQFPTVTSTRYSFDGSTQAWNSWLGSDTEHPPGPPDPVLDTAAAVQAAARTRDWDALRRLSEGTSCTSSDQPEPCVPYWKDQEANGEDPLGTLATLLEPPATKHPDAPMWVWPRQWAAGDGYSGARVGIDDDGVWRYFVQEGQG